MDADIHFDPLTALPGPARFHGALRRAIARADAADRCFSVLSIGLDWSGSAKVKLARGARERLLMEVARRLREATRKSDLVARLGDVRFGILLGDTSAKAALAVANNVSALLSASVSEGDCRFMLDVAVGLACFPDHGRTGPELLAHADGAMRRAREDGGDHHGWPRPHLPVSRRLHLDARLRAALASGTGLSLRWRPLVRLADGAVVGAEAQPHWEDGALGAVEPDILAQVAEQSGLAANLDGWLLEQVAQEGTRWLAAAPMTEGCVAVNLSPAWMRRPEAIDEILAIVYRHGLRPGQLELDVTEKALPDFGAMAWHVVRTLGTAGVSFAVDAFGSAHSNLGALARLAPSRLKLGPAFVRNVSTSGIDRALASTLAFLGRSLGIKVVAEAVEALAQLELLHDLGCEEAQGQLFGPPADLAALGLRWATPAPD